MKHETKSHLLSALTIVCIFTFLALFTISFAPEKKYKVEMPVQDWIIYTNNVSKLQNMAGRGNVPSDVLLATKDTVNYYQQIFVNSIQEQLKSDTIKQHK